MFDRVAARYDLANDVLSLGQDRAWRRLTVHAVQPRPGQLILDLAAGTGTSSEPFAAAGATVVPTDLSLGMLQVGKQRRPGLSFVAADALQLPYADASFDAVTISFGLRNVEDTSTALREMLRVTRPGGALVICEFSTPTWAPFRTVYANYLVAAIPRLASLVSSNPVPMSTSPSPSRPGRTSRRWPRRSPRPGGNPWSGATCPAASSRCTEPVPESGRRLRRRPPTLCFRRVRRPQLPGQDPQRLRSDRAHPAGGVRRAARAVRRRPAVPGRGARTADHLVRRPGGGPSAAGRARRRTGPRPASRP